MKSQALFLVVTTLFPLLTRSQEAAPPVPATDPVSRAELPRVVSLFASGEAKVAADTVVVTLRHQTEAAKLSEALDGSAAAKEKLLETLTTVGIPKSAIIFQNFTSGTDHGSLLGKVKGYTVTAPVEIRVKTETDFGKIAALIDANAQWSLVDRRPDMNDATSVQFKAAENAVENLRKKAALYEKAFGVKLELYSFSEISQDSMKSGQNPAIFGVAGVFGTESIDGLISGKFPPGYRAPGATVSSFGEMKTEVNLRGVYRIVD